MKQVIFDKSGRVLIKNVPVPAISDNEVLIKNEFSVVSAGTEKSMIQLMKKPLWKMALDRPDLTSQVLKFAKDSGIKQTMNLVKSRLDVWHLLGYSSAGIVVKSNTKDFAVGDRVACIGSGFANHAEYVAVPKTLVAKIPKAVETVDACFTGVACIALQSIRQLNPQLGDRVAVVGLGLIGQMVAQMLRANGCKVIGIDLDKSKTEAAYVDEPVSKDTVGNVMKATNGIGADGVIIAAASKYNLVNDAFDMCRKKAKVVLLGLCPIEIDRQKMFEKELDFTVSTAFGAGTFDYKYEKGIDYPIEYARWTAGRNMQAVLDLIETNKLTFVQDDIFDIDKAKEAYTKINKGSITTALIRYNPKEPKQTIEINKKLKGKINVAIIGAGQFIRGFILPNLTKDFSIYAIVNKTGSSARQLAEKYKAKLASTSYRDILNDKNVDLVIIGTRHNTHAKIAIAALKKGKHVYSEKPVALTTTDLKTLKDEIQKSKKLYTCGFNRRYSPAVNSIKERLEEKPMMINYVFNNAILPDDHWVNQKEGGGRILGEACHIADLFIYLTGSKPVKIDAYQLSSTKRSNDSNNISAIMKFKDGSIATLTYSSTGSAKAERERLTVIQDGDVFDMNGFGKVSLNRKTIYSGSADEGHAQQIVELAKKLTSKNSKLATADECLTATAATFSMTRVD